MYNCMKSIERYTFHRSERINWIFILMVGIQISYPLDSWNLIRVLYTENHEFFMVIYPYLNRPIFLRLLSSFRLSCILSPVLFESSLRSTDVVITFPCSFMLQVQRGTKKGQSENLEPIVNGRVKAVTTVFPEECES